MALGSLIPAMKVDIYLLNYKAGSSQGHKHIQVLPETAYKQSNILLTITEAIQPGSTGRYCLKLFKRIRHSIRAITDDRQNIYDTYIQLIRDISGKTFLTNDSIQSLKYNLIMTKSFMMIVERKREKYANQIAINAVGYTGSILLRNAQQLRMLEDVHAIQILEEVSELVDDDRVAWEWI